LINLFFESTVDLSFIWLAVGFAEHCWSKGKDTELMEWKTIYITGKEKFSNEVLEQLEKSDLPFMVGTNDSDRNLDLYWIQEGALLRDFKKAIGAKTVFKYRLRFFNPPEKLNERQEKQKFSSREEAMISEMKSWQRKQSAFV
jgi:hypothetical protein